MSRNTKKENYKEYLALQRRDKKLSEERKNLGYRELPKPIHHGYNAYLELREDIAKRTDKEGLAYQYIVKHFSTETWSKTPEFFNRRKRWYIWGINDNRPKIRKLTEREFDELHPSIAKYFYNFKIDNKFHWSGKEYRVYSHIIPDHYLVMKVKKSFLTHQKIIDSELEREISFVDDKLQQFYDTSPFWRNNCFKWFRTHQNRRDRHYNKIALAKNLRTSFYNDSYERYKESIEIHNLEMEALGKDDLLFKPCSRKEFEEETTINEWAYVSGWECDPYEFVHKHRNSAKYNWW